MIALLALAAFASEPDAPALAEALSTELARNQQQLSLPGAPPLYFARYRGLLLDQLDVEARFGSVVRRSDAPYRMLGIELRVGDLSFDNSGFGGWQNGFLTDPLPAVPTPEAAASVAWRSTDRAYKEAVEQYARKAAQVERGDEHPGDYTAYEPIQADLGSAALDEADPLIALARDLSAATAVERDGVITERGEVHIGAEAGTELLVDTDGSQLIQPRAELTLRVASQMRAADGQLLSDHLLWTVRSAEDLPPAEEMVADARRMAEELASIAAEAPVLDEEYVGPVLFEGEAALDLLRYVLIPQLEGTPDDVPFDSFLGDLGSSSSAAVRLNRRVLPLGWSVVDDPSAHPEHPGYAAYDAEGVPVQPVELVSEGIVHDLLMSRTPRSDLRESNGHARGGFGVRARGRAMAVTVTPDRHLSEGKLNKRARKLARSYERDWIFVVKRLQEPSVMAIGDYSRFPRFEPSQPTLPPPVVLVRRYSDGREEQVRGAAFTGVQRFVLRDIVGAGGQNAGSYLVDSNGEPAGFTPTGGLPTWMSGPDLLIGEMELVPLSGDPRSLPVIPPASLTAADLTPAP